MGGVFDNVASSCSNDPIMPVRKKAYSPILAARIDNLAQKRSRQKTGPSRCQNHFVPAAHKWFSRTLSVKVFALLLFGGYGADTASPVPSCPGRDQPVRCRLLLQAPS